MIYRYPQPVSRTFLKRVLPVQPASCGVAASAPTATYLEGSVLSREGREKNPESYSVVFTIRRDLSIRAFKALKFVNCSRSISRESRMTIAPTRRHPPPLAATTAARLPDSRIRSAAAIRTEGIAFKLGGISPEVREPII